MGDNDINSRDAYTFLLIVLLTLLLISFASAQNSTNHIFKSEGINATITIGNYIANYDKYQIENNSITFWNLSYTSNCSKLQFYSIFNYTTPNSSIDLPCLTTNLTNPINNSFLSSYINNFTISISNVIFGIQNITLNIWDMSDNIINQTTISPIGIVNSGNFGVVVTLIDKIYKWAYSGFDKQHNPFISVNNTATIAIPPEITIYDPQPIYYSSKFNLALNYLVTDREGIGVNYTNYYLVNSTGSIIIANTTLIANTTFSVPRDDIYNLTIFSVDLNGNSNISLVRFGVYSAGPVILLKKPIDKSWSSNISTNFSFEITDLNPVSICSIYTNITGDWNPFYTFFPPITNNGTMSVIKNVNTNGYYIWNVWCIDSAGLNNFALNNFELGVDNTSPNITNVNVDTEPGSQTAQFSFNVSEDTRLDSCWRSLRNSSGQIDPVALENVSVPCNSANNSFTVMNYGSYTLEIWANNSAGLLNKYSKNLTISQLSTTSPGGGVGTTVIVTTGIELTQNFSVVSSNYGNILDLVLAKGSVRDRYKEFILVNKGLNEIDITLYCDPTDIDKNISQIRSIDINICDYVYFDQREIKISPNEDTPTKARVFVRVPENVSFGDKYAFNVVALRNISSGVSTYSKLSVTARVPIWALVLKYSYIPFQAENKENKSSYPVSAVAFPLSLLILFGFVFLLREKYPVLGFLLGFLAGVIAFILMIIFF